MKKKLAKGIKMRGIGLFMYCSLILMVSTANAATLSIEAGSYVDVYSAFGSTYTQTHSQHGYEGIVAGTTQVATGAHYGAIDGSESPSIVMPWIFFDSVALFGTNQDANILSVSANTAQIDLSGLYFLWGPTGEEQTQLDTGAFAGNQNGIGEIICEVTCAEGEQYTLLYSAAIQDPYPTVGLAFVLHYQGTITNGNLTAVPVLPALWFFGSGLLALTGVLQKQPQRGRINAENKGNKGDALNLPRFDAHSPRALLSPLESVRQIGVGLLRPRLCFYNDYCFSDNSCPVVIHTIPDPAAFDLWQAGSGAARK